MKVRNVKIHWENVYFMRMRENDKKMVRRRVVLQGKDFLRADIIYKVLLQLRNALRVTYWGSASVRVHEPPAGPPKSTYSSPVITFPKK